MFQFVGDAGKFSRASMMTCPFFPFQHKA
jgi:hypothetical protein